MEVMEVSLFCLKGISGISSPDYRMMTVSHDHNFLTFLMTFICGVFCGLCGAGAISIQHREHKDTTLISSPTRQRSIFIKSADYHNPENYVNEDLSSLYASHDDVIISISSSLSSTSWSNTTTTPDINTFAVCKLHSEAQELNHFPHFMQPMHQCIDYWIQRQDLNNQQEQQQSIQAILLYDHSVAKNLAGGLKTSEFIQGKTTRSNGVFQNLSIVH
jgi:hypothetical protein